jgi:hypothetical protein
VPAVTIVRHDGQTGVTGRDELRAVSAGELRRLAAEGRELGLTVTVSDEDLAELHELNISMLKLPEGENRPRLQGEVACYRAELLLTADDMLAWVIDVAAGTWARLRTPDELDRDLAVNGMVALLGPGVPRDPTRGQ